MAHAVPQGVYSRTFKGALSMGISLPGTLVRTGEERATLVRRTYGLVFISVIVTALGVGFGFTQPRLMEAVARHPIITMIAMFAPLWMAMQARHSFPKNLVLTLLFTFIEGIWLAPFLFMAERQAPGITGQAGLLTLSAFGVLSLYAVFSKRDFSAWGSFFIVGLWVLIATSVINIFVGSALASVWIAGGTVLV